ncbi:neutral/alkaline non-lysosomal ceramidase N-terminal domain-containing protein [Kribbella kalugense]|uniref:Neutral/alkaline ceramidase-like enzyme n=1 Tax=Kribbella kalugense TaxID=2512221 RepID=A0A4R7ZLJ0_9ACTN|nr:neutral/alkaline non-lysosomal ceramidase N-terminal domain-containing protein [Kribbella kalugense]TDW18275.1 neutral/alkaline ceramidase-like enzyme [Kribbella kalugense]
MTELLLAATSLDVTPPPGHRLDGYAARAGVATGTADSLRATLIWLSTAHDPGVLWLTLDAIAVGAALVAELAETAGAAAGIPASQVVVSASHTHSGPSGWTGEIHPVIPAAQERSLVDPLLAAVRGAQLDRQPVTASWRSIEVTGVGTNRHRRNGPHDNTAGILALHSLSGSLEAVLLDFACHPTTYGPENLQYSADWPGAARDALAPAVVGFLQGAAGDVSPRFTRQGRGAAEVARLGNLLAARVREALADPGLELPQSAPAIRRTTLTLPVRSIPTVDESEELVTAAERGVNRADDATGRISQTRLEGARGQALMAAAALPPTLDLPVSAVTMGDVCWINLPVELFAVHGACLEHDSTHPITRVIGYTDGYYGYVVDPSAAEAGTYEALITFFDQPTTNTLLTETATFANT